MAQVTSLTSFAGISSETWYPAPPVEWGRAGGSVATITLGTATGDDGTGGGTNGTVDNKATTYTGPATRGTAKAIDGTAGPTSGGGSGLKVDLTIASNKCSAIVVDAHADADGDGYRIGDKITIAKADSGTSTDVVGYVASLEYEN